MFLKRIINLQESLKARYKIFKSKHFEYFPEGQYLKRLNGIHKGSRCFIIGNGPSLSASDLSKIHKHNEISFAFNRIYYFLSQTPWVPTYYISQDYKMLQNCSNEVREMPAGVKLIPAELKWYYGIDVKDAHYFHIENSEINNKPLFSSNIAQKVINSKTVVFSAIQFAVYMGIKEIYLIGVDHHFHTSMNSKGEIEVDPNAKDYFTDEYNKDKDDLYIPNTDLSTLTYMAAKEYTDAHGIKIYNATRGGRLEVFPRVDFDSLFNNLI